ncbi:hypothetical protein SDC9_196358 [bioreactor metagenome]|uniref:Uncharacterized protein n=1 Tax=bioreactor metagenome TaxID=1076179 RepID=A0A645ICW2_9ZZZZ
MFGHFAAAGFFHTMRDTDRCAHAHDRVYGAQWRQRAQRIAAYVGRYGKIKFFQRIEHRPVRATGTQHRRTHRQPGRLMRAKVRRTAKERGNLTRKQLTLESCLIFTGAFNAPAFYHILKEWFHILYDDKLVYL